MSEKELRRSLSVFPIGTVMKLTDLTARQIRYYEEQQLIRPERTDTNRRMYSLNDVDHLLEIKDYLSEGLSIMAIQKIFERQSKALQQKDGQLAGLTDEDVRRIFYSEIMHISGLSGNDRLF
ncbi:MerR family transcriptional regulator [Granulicatella seriolae]|uniref:MerR family transcriptional regulator n=1 Tax=Granulicatella seriolae TaxID=2967226 RepID=A0ABT1WPN8_9LACT|nr:MerR family transcriptional regulator [Granulicatella seriolae]